jgi:low temperature requirement protein LtrA
MDTPAARDAPGLARSLDRPPQVTFLELFFDLVYVFALTQLSQFLLDHFNWAGAGRTLLLVLPVLWVWTVTAWTTDVFDPARAAVQVPIVAVMVGILVMSVSVPRAYGSSSLAFAGVYVAIQACTQLYYLFLLRRSRLRRYNVRVLSWSAVSAAGWIIGALRGGASQVLLWGLAVVVDYVSALARWWVPGLGRTEIGGLALRGEHVSERYRQFFIIALGETILTSGSAYSQHGFTGWRFAALVASFATTALLGRIYIYRAGQLLGQAIAHGPESWRPGNVAAYVNIVMIAGVVVTAAGDELVIIHPVEDARPAWVGVVLGGPVLFLAGRALLDYTVFARVSRSRLIGVAVLGALSPGMPFVPLLVVDGVTVLVLLGVAVANVASWRRRPLVPVAALRAR